MDRSLDSIGSCSLDVDADSSDISDTSGSLNFPTPLSVKDITREFTANIRERCTLRSPLQPQSQPQRTTATTTAYVTLGGEGGGGGPAVRMVLSPPTTNDATAVDAIDVGEREKKPSYLNLACCVNGYSNLTTYDSKIRQDINKSREVSPIRPSTSSLQYCKRNNSLAAPVLHSMPLTKQPLTAAPTSSVHKYNETNNNNSGNGALQNGDHLYCNGDKSQGSFIQQRVERLYGPGALAQVFYSPKKNSGTLSPVPGARQRKQLAQPDVDVTSQGSELSRKFKQLSPSKDYGEFNRKLQQNSCSQRVRPEQAEPNAHNGDVDLPVFRHLSHEFRAQLPTVSPKRCVPRVSPAPEVPLPRPLPVAQAQSQSNGATDTVDHEAVKPLTRLGTEEYLSTTKISSMSSTTSSLPAEVEVAAASGVRDGNYFLKVLKDEQVRLLALAAVAEKYIDALTNNPDITEDTFGLLRSASGKARLLVSQKMKQFEGLCHNNLNRSPEDAFPTTLDDLQGFWDMVYLQVTHVDSIFADIETLKSNDWQRAIEAPKAVDSVPTKSLRTPKTGNLKARTPTGGAAGSSSKPAASSSVAAMKREAQRKQLLEMKRQRREALAAASASASADAGDVAAADLVTENNQSDCGAAIGDTVMNAVKNSS